MARDFSGGDEPGCLEFGTVAGLATWRQWLGTPGLFRLAVARVADGQAASGLLSPDELARADAFTHGRRRQQWLAGRVAAKFAAGLLLHRLNGATGEAPALAPEEWLIDARSDGRPYLRPPDGIILPVVPDISISHSGDLAVAMAVSRGYCGIDIQQSSAKVLKVRERFCLNRETVILDRDPALAGLDAIGRHTLLWAAKEAVIKATGRRCLEIGLEKVVGPPDSQEETGYLFEMAIHRTGEFAKETMPCKVVAMFLEDYALAFTVAG